MGERHALGFRQPKKFSRERELTHDLWLGCRYSDGDVWRMLPPRIGCAKLEMRLVTGRSYPYDEQPWKVELL
jgi:hypothetical protein